MAEKEKSRCILLIGSFQEELQGLGIILGNAQSIPVHYAEIAPGQSQVLSNSSTVILIHDFSYPIQIPEIGLHLRPGFLHPGLEVNLPLPGSRNQLE